MSDDELGANDPNDTNPADGGEQPLVPSSDSEAFDGEPAYDATEAALGLLSPDEAAAMLAAAANDPDLAKELAEFQAVVAELARLAPPAPINRGRSAGIRSRLLTRAAASRAGRPVTRQTGPIETAAMFGAPSTASTGAAAASPAGASARQTSPRGGHALQVVGHPVEGDPVPLPKGEGRPRDPVPGLAHGARVDQGPHRRGRTSSPPSGKAW